MVLETTSLVGYSVSRVHALGDGENSAYASSTTTIPGAASRSRRRSPESMTWPVGLLGVVTNRMSGWRSVIAVRAPSTSMDRSSARSTGIHSVSVPAARMGCME